MVNHSIVEIDADYIRSGIFKKLSKHLNHTDFYHISNLLGLYNSCKPVRRKVR